MNGNQELLGPRRNGKKKWVIRFTWKERKYKEWSIIDAVRRSSGGQTRKW